MRRSAGSSLTKCEPGTIHGPAGRKVGRLFARVKPPRRLVSHEVRAGDDPRARRQKSGSALRAREAAAPVTQDRPALGDVVDHQVAEVRGGVHLVQTIEVDVAQRDAPQLEFIVEQREGPLSLCRSGDDGRVGAGGNHRLGEHDGPSPSGLLRVCAERQAEADHQPHAALQLFGVDVDRREQPLRQLAPLERHHLRAG